MVIGIVGGMGSYATVDFFRRLVAAFPADKEWERPRIIVDNYCTMPSRVRAILYNERKEELCKDLVSSVELLLRGGATKIILVCNTSHVFLPDIYRLLPEAKNCIVDIIDALADELYLINCKKVNLIASEGTIQTKIYDDKFSKYGIDFISPNEVQYEQLREFIEAIKQNNIPRSVMEKFCSFVNSCSSASVILGCTELPILYNFCIQAGYTFNKKIFDPLQSVINKICNAE